MCGLSGHGMNRDANSGWCVQAFGRAVWWTCLISWVVLLECLLGAGLSHAQEAPAPLPEVSLAAGPVTERTGAVSTLERTGVASSSVTSVTEGADAVFTLERTGATSEALAVMVRLSETGSMLASRLTAAGDYEYLTVTFGVGESSAVLRAPTDDDAVVEAPSTVTAWLLPDVSTDYTVGSARLARVTVTDNDTATFTVFAAPAEIAEGETAAIAVDVEGGVFAQNQSITLNFSGDGQAADYRVADNNNQPLTAPYTLVLPAGEVAVTAAVTALADGEAESAETVVIEARHDSAVIGTVNLTIAAGDAALESEAELASLSLRNASMGAFFSDVFTYRANVGSGITYTMIRAPPTNPRATVSVSATGASLQNEGAWMVPLAPAANTVSITVTSADRQASTTYTVTVYRAVGVTAWGGRDAAGDFDLLAEQEQQTLPAGLWSDGEFLWVADWDTDSLLAYSLADKARRPGWDFSPLAAGSPAGMWSDGRTLWVADYHEGGIYAYSMATGERLPDQDISLAQGNDDPTGIWSDGETLWVADYRDHKAYAYGLRDGARRIDADIDFNGEEAIHPFGMWSDGETLWVANWLGGELRAYRLEDGERQEDKDIDLSEAGNGYPMGIWSDGATLYVSDTSNTRIYAYTAVKQFAYDEALQAVPSDNALLETLSLSGVDLGGFSSELMNYSATVDFDVDETVVEAVAAGAGAALRISGAGGTSQGGQRTVPLSVGLNVITITVTAQTGSVNTYSVVVFRTMSLTPGDASLSFLSLSGINFGDFTGTLTEYTASVAHTLETTRVTALPVDDDASVVITAAGGAGSTEGRQKDVALAQGQNTITITVTAPEGTTQSYSVVVTRAGPPSVDPSGGVVDPPIPIPVTAVTLMLSPALINENGGISTVTAMLSHASNEAATVTVSAEAVAPAGSSDFSLSANTVLTIAAGATTSSGTVTITAVNNDVDAPDRTVTVKGAASNNLDVSGLADLSLTIANDDVRGVTVSAATLDINEGGTGTYTVVLDSEPAGTVTVTPARSSGDSDVSVSAALSFTALTWDTPRTVTVSAGEDTDALDDTAVIGHTVSGADYGGETAASVAVTVDDDETDPTGVTLSVSPDAVSEGAGATMVTVTARLNGGSRNTATAVSVTVGSGTAVSDTDFDQVTGFTITIAADQVSGAGTFSLMPTNDTVDEPNETVSITGLSGSLTVTPATLMIEDNDAAPTVTLALSSTSISENGGVSTVTATLSHASSEDTTVTVSAAPVAPASSLDYSLSLNTVLSIAAEATSSSGTVTITAVNNDVDAADRTVTVRGSASNALDVSGPADLSLTITNDDTRGVTVSETELDINEDGTGTYTVVLNSKPAGPVTVTPERSGDSDVSVTGPLNFTTGNWATPQTVTVSAGEDTDAVDDTAVIGHTVSGADYGGVGAASVAVTVDDDETDPTGVTLSVSPDVVGEGAGATTVTVTAVLNGGSRGTATEVAVTVGSGTAVSDTDFTAVTGFTLTIAANQVSTTGTFRLTPSNDTVDEPDETVEVSGTTTATGFTVTDATLTIEDNDAAPTVTLALSSTSISESSGVSTVTATLDHASSEDTTVTVSAAPGDFSLSVNRTLTIAANSTSSSGTVTITANNNDVDAPDKSVTISGSVTTVTAVAPSDVTLTITDDEAAPTVTLALMPALIGEAGGVSTVSAALDHASSEATTVTVSVVAVSPAAAGDFRLSTSTTLTIAAGATTSIGVVTITAADNDVDASNKTVTVSATAANGQGITDPSGATLTITDDDAPSTRVTLTVAPDEVNEGGGPVTLTVTGTLDAGTRNTATEVTLAVNAGTATLTDDYTVTGATLTIAAKQSSASATLTVTPEDDAVAEGPETFSIGGTVSGLTVTAATVTLVDNDGTPTVLLLLTPASIAEDGEVSTVTATLSNVSGDDTVVTVSAAPVAPASSSDYSLSANTVLTIAAGATTSSGAVTITANNNTVDAPDKTVTVSAAAVNDAGVTAPSGRTLTITDDEAAPTVTLALTPASIGEAGGVSTVSAALDHASSEATTVTVSVVAVSPAAAGDFRLSTSTTLTIAAGATTSIGVVTITAADNDVDASNKTVTVSATAANGQGITDPAGETLTITDDDIASTEVTLTVAPDEVNEGGGPVTLTVTGTLDAGTRNTATEVTLAVNSGSATLTDDYTATGATLTIAAKQSSASATLTVTPEDDGVAEGPETFSIGGTVSGLTVTAATVTLVDNDGTPTVLLLLTPASIAEDGEVSTVTATLSNVSGDDTVVTVSAAPVAPASSSDYSLSANTVLTIAAGATTSSGAVTITANNNTVDAPDKTVTVSAAAVNDAGVTAPSGRTLTITDDEAAPTVTLALMPASIGEAGGVSTVSAALDHASSEATTVTVSVVAVSPAAAGDFRLSTSTTLTIAAGATTSIGVVTITAADNDVDASNKTVTVSATAANGQGITDPSGATLTITDDDAPSTRVTLTVAPDEVNEGGGPVTLTVTGTLDAGTRNTATEVTLAVNSGSATLTDDYTATGATLTIAAKQSSASATLTVTPEDDAVAEGPETFSIGGTVSGLTVTAATVTLVDNDGTPTVLLLLTPASIAEDGEVSTVTATLSNVSGDDTVVTVSAAPVAPASSSDYSLSANTVLTIAAGATTSSGAVTITANNNTVDAPDKTVTVSAAAVNDAGVTAPSGRTLTITDDEAAPTVTLALMPASIGEAGGVSTVSAALDHASSEATTVTVSAVAVLPAAAGDFRLSTSTTLTIAAGATTSIGVVTITAADNDVDTSDKTVTVSATAANGQGITDPAGATLTITDDDAPSTRVTLTVAPDEVNEGGGPVTLTVTGTLDAGTRNTATEVTLAVNSGSATLTDDYTATGATLTIAAKQSSASATLTVTPEDDAVAEGPETFSIGGTVSGLTVTAATVTLVDNDGTPTVLLLLTPASIAEDGEVSTVTATLSNVSGDDTVVTVSAAPVAPASSSDYSLSANTVLTIAAGATTSSGAVTITANNNTVDAPDKTVTVSAAAVNDAGVTAPSGRTLTITDDEAAPTVTLALMPASIGEAGGVSTVSAALDHASSEATTVTVSAVAVLPAAAGDFRLSTSTTLTIAAGATTSTGVVTITAADNDVDAFDKTVTVSATAANGQGITDPSGETLTITDDDAPSTRVTLTVAPDEVNEGGGPVTLTVTGTLDAGTRNTATEVTLAVNSGSATLTDDYTATGATLTIAAKQSSASATLTVTPEDDAVAEGPETFSIGGTVSGLTVTAATVTLVDNDGTPTVLLLLTPASIAEDGEVSTVTATLSNVSGDDTVVTVSAAPVAPASSLDYSLSANTVLTIAAGATTSSGAVTITANNNTVDAPDKTVTVSAAAVNDAGVTAPSGRTLTITDDEAAPEVTLALMPALIGEAGGVSTVSAALDHASSEATTVTVSAVAVSPAAAGDFRLSTSTTLTIAAGATTSIGVVTITAADNDVDASNKTVTVSATAANGQGITDPSGETLTITDDDAPSTRVTLTVAPDEVNEGGGPVTLTVTGTLDAGTRNTATEVTLAVNSGSATLTDDYTATGATLTIAAKQSSASATLTVTPEDDAVAEGPETFSIGGTVSGLTVTAATVTLVDNDGTPTVLLLLTPASIAEDGEVSTVTATLSNVSGDDTVVTVSAAPVAPASSSDYSLSANTVLTIAAGATTSSGAVTITANNNTVDAPDKTVTVSAAAVNDAGVTAPSGRTLTITDDEAAPTVTLALTPASIGEAGGVSTVSAALDHASSEATTVTVSVVAVSPAAAGDFRLSTSTTLTIAAGATTSIGVVTITAADNDVDASNKTVTVSATAANGQGITDPSGATLTITDDDIASNKVTLTVAPDEVVENAAARRR